MDDKEFAMKEMSLLVRAKALEMILAAMLPSEAERAVCQWRLTPRPDLSWPPAFLLDGGSHPAWAESIVQALGLRLIRGVASTFPDGELCVRLPDTALVGSTVVILQAMCSAADILLVYLLLDALKRGGARHLVVVSPFFPYARQDRRTGGESLGAALIARQLEEAGAGAVVTCDLHNPGLEGCFRVVEHLLPTGPLIAAWRAAGLDRDLMIVGPDPGAFKRALACSSALDADDPLVLCKRRSGVDATVWGLSDNFRGRSVMLVDDSISSGQTIAQAVDGLVDRGAARVYVSITHVVRTVGLERLLASKVEKVFVTDTRPVGEMVSPRVQVVTLEPLFMSAIARLLSAA